MQIAYRASYLSAFFEFQSADLAAPYHAFIVNYVAADNFRHHGQIEVADLRMAFGESMKDTIGRLDSRPFLFRVDRPRLIAQFSHDAGLGPDPFAFVLNAGESARYLTPHSFAHSLKPFAQCVGALFLAQRIN